MSRTALVVEDDSYLHQALTDALSDAGLTARIVSSGAAALEACSETAPEIILLDLCLPDMDGLDVCRQLRSHSAVPIVMLTARHSEVDRIVGLEVGADDYVTKPFHRGELVARIRAILRRVNEYPQQDGGRELSVPPVHIRKDRRVVTCRGAQVDLTPKEFDLLCALASRPHEVIPSRELLWDVWQYPEGIRTRTLDVHIGRLRGKLEVDRKSPKIIVTVPGVGYKIQSQAA